MLKTKNKKNLIIARAETAKRLNALIVTGLCVFVLGCLIWPFTVNTFRSVASISIATHKNNQSKTQLEQALARIIREETSDERLEAIVSQIEVAGKIRSKQIEFRDHEWIKKALQISIGEREYGFDFRLGFDGVGGEDEQELVKMLAQRIAIRLAPDSPSRRPSKSASQNYSESLGKLHSQQSQSFELAKWIVDQIENDLKSVKITLGRLGDGAAGLARNAAESNDNESQFQFASSKRVVEETGDLKATIESIDLQSLREVLAEMRKRADAQANLINAQSPASSDVDLAGPIVIGTPNQIETRPLNNSPSAVSFCLLALASLIVGSVVAFNFKPFESRGFENARSVGRLLGLPVVARIHQETASSSSEPIKRKIFWANRVTSSAGLLLFGIFVVVAGFVLINPGVRDAFYENPLFGCTKIIRIFAGY